jgi:hypothetical protein
MNRREDDLASAVDRPSTRPRGRGRSRGYEVVGRDRATDEQIRTQPRSPSSVASSPTTRGGGSRRTQTFTDWTRRHPPIVPVLNWRRSRVVPVAPVVTWSTTLCS